MIFTSLLAGREKLARHSNNVTLLMVLLILFTCMLNEELRLLGEIIYWSILEWKGLLYVIVPLRNYSYIGAYLYS